MARGEFLLRPAGLLSGLFGYLGGNGVYMVMLLLSRVVLGLLTTCCMQRLAWCVPLQASARNAPPAVLRLLAACGMPGLALLTPWLSAAARCKTMPLLEIPSLSAGHTA